MSIAASDRAAVAHFVRACGAGVVSTVSADGGPHAERVALTATENGFLVFAVPHEGRIATDIRARSAVAAVVSGAEISVQLEGRARLSVGSEQQTLAELFVEHFPDSHALDDGYAVVAVSTNWVRVCEDGLRPPHVSEAPWSQLV